MWIKYEKICPSIVTVLPSALNWQEKTGSKTLVVFWAYTKSTIKDRWERNTCGIFLPLSDSVYVNVNRKSFYGTAHRERSTWGFICFIFLLFPLPSFALHNWCMRGYNNENESHQKLSKMKACRKQGMVEKSREK